MQTQNKRFYRITLTTEVQMQTDVLFIYKNEIDEQLANYFYIIFLFVCLFCFVLFSSECQV